MPAKQWKSELEAAQLGYLPLIVNALLGVQILSAVRDPIVIGLDLPLELIAINIVLIAVMTALAVWVRIKEIPGHLSSKIIMFAVLCAGAKAIASIAVQAEPLPFYMAVLMLSLSLCFLSQKHMLIAAGVITVAWAMVTAFTLTRGEMVSTFFAMLIGFALGVEGLRRRILSLIEVFELKSRVETLESILPMCASCKKTRNETGNWINIENYIEDNQAGLQVSHGMCPECYKAAYGTYLERRNTERRTQDTE